MKTANEIATDILTSNLSTEDMNVIISAINNARRLNRQKNSAVAMASMRVGAIGKLQNLSPKSLNGTKVEIKEIKRTRVTVQEVDNPTWGGRYTVPASCISFE